jgi:hypothetical protein
MSKVAMAGANGGFGLWPNAVMPGRVDPLERHFNKRQPSRRSIES